MKTIEMKKTIQLITAFIILSFNLSSCGIIVREMAKSEMTAENGAIPTRFGKSDEVLVCVLKGEKSRDRYMKKHIEAEYKGKYIFVLEDELSSDEYKDTNKYRYEFNHDTKVRQVSTVGSDGFPDKTTVSSAWYYIKDRKTQKKYSGGMGSSFHSKLIKAYVMNLEKLRTANQ